MVWYTCDLRQFPVCSYSMFNWWYLIYVYSFYTSHMFLVSLGLVILFLYYKCLSQYSLKNLANIFCMIIDFYCFDFADMSCCEIDDWHHSLYDIFRLLYGLVNIRISFKYCQEYSCSSFIGIIRLQVNIFRSRSG